MAALTCSLKKESHEIVPDKLCNICAAAPFRIKAVVQNEETTLNNLFGHSQLTYKSIAFAINIIFLHPLCVCYIHFKVSHYKFVTL